MLNYFVALANTLAQRLGRDDRGATAVEYGMIVALIAAIIVGTVALLGTPDQRRVHDDHQRALTRPADAERGARADEPSPGKP